jgi:predicted RNA-binding Zn-ribbon protein involved in translation (DUF1610 family)
MDFVDEENDELEIEDDVNEDHSTHFQVNVSSDRDGFLRHTCPDCGRDFKTAINDAQLSHLLHSEVERVGREMGLSIADEESDEENSTLICPYCAHRAKPNDMLPDELLNYLKRQVYRQIVYPMIDKTFGGLADSTRRNNFIRIEYSGSSLPPRPIHGPEPADMKIVNLLCCGERVKISDTWNGMENCPYCGESIIFV